MNRPHIRFKPTYGTWTPNLTFATPGDLLVQTSEVRGSWTKMGREILVRGDFVTSLFTHTTAAGSLRIDGLPFPPGSSGIATGTGVWAGITKAGYTQIVPYTAGSNYIEFSASGSGVGGANVTAADMPSGGAPAIRLQLVYPIF